MKNLVLNFETFRPNKIHLIDIYKKKTNAMQNIYSPDYYPEFLFSFILKMSPILLKYYGLIHFIFIVFSL